MPAFFQIAAAALCNWLHDFNFGFVMLDNFSWRHFPTE
jgi:hypothetical protein